MYCYFEMKVLTKIKKKCNNYSAKLKLIEVKETRSVTMNIFSKKIYFLFKSFVKIELSYVFTIDLFSTAESCMEQ